MKKVVTLSLMAALLVVLFSACGHTHVWTEATCTEPKICLEDGATEGEPLGHDWVAATCTEPKTCARCGETEGEPLGHEWKDATCTEPKTCTRCGATEGEPLGHTPLEADYWTPSICAVCGEELGPVLEPDFEAVYGLHPNMELGETYDLTVHCFNDATRMTTGHVTVVSYDIFPALESYDCGNGVVWNFEAKDGYEWRVVAFEEVFDDENAWYYGVNNAGLWCDYYLPTRELPPDDAYERTDYGTVLEEEIVYKGETYNIRSVNYFYWSPDYDTKCATTYSIYAVQVPTGYDGRIFGAFDYYQQAPEGGTLLDIADDSWLFFRLD